MPTGYTAKLCDGEQSFEEFVLRCARAFGALIEMRDESFNAPIPDEFKPSGYHARELEKARTKYNSVRKMSISAATKRAKEEYESKKKEILNTIKGRAATRARLDAMLLAVSEWGPPTAGHVSLKSFMAEQLNKTIELDGNAAFWQEQLNNLTCKSGEGYIQEQLSSIKWSIDYHTEQHQKEVGRINERNRWVAELRESLRR